MSVYILTNAAMPGIVKVGRSVEPESRAVHLSSASGVPLPFQVSWIYETFDDCAVEHVAHVILAERRVNPSREFFACEVGVARSAVERAALMAAWNRASPDARQEFLQRIDAPVFDAGAA